MPNRLGRTLLAAVLAALMLSAPGAATASAGHTAADAAGASATFQNPVRWDAADPWMVYRDGQYVLVYTVDTHLTVVRSRSVAGLRDAPAVTVWTKDSHPDTPCCHMWAPEMHYLDGRWYLYFSATDDSDSYDDLHNYVLESAGADPLGPYTFKGRIAPPGQDYKAIDASVYQEADGDLYHLWSCYPPGQPEGQSICIAPMSNPWTVSGTRTKISVGESDEGCTVREGPVILRRNNTLNLVYSICNFADSSYRLRLQTASASGDVTDPAGWSAPSTVFSTGNGVYGPGHNGFFTSPDGTETWIVYHGYVDACGLSCRPRDTYVQKIDWDGDRPVLGSPVSRDTVLTVPSGDPGVDRYEAEDAHLTNARVLDGPGTSGGRKVGYIDYADSTVTFPVTAGTAGPHRLSVRYNNGWGASSHRLTVNGGSPVDVPYANNGFDVWATTTVTVDLAAGANTVVFGKGASFTELDYIEVTPQS